MLLRLGDSTKPLAATDFYFLASEKVMGPKIPTYRNRGGTVTIAPAKIAHKVARLLN